MFSFSKHALLWNASLAVLATCVTNVVGLNAMGVEDPILKGLALGALGYMIGKINQ